MTLPNPWIILSAIVAVSIAFFSGHHAGYAKKEMEDQLEIARLNGEMTKQKEVQDVKDEETKQEFEAKLSATIASRPRLYIPISSKSGCSTSSSNNGQERAELDGQTVEDLIRLVAEGDRAIIELNSCIDRYNQVKETLSGNR